MKPHIIFKKKEKKTYVLLWNKFNCTLLSYKWSYVTLCGNVILGIFYIYILRIFNDQTELNSCDLFSICWINPRRVFVENNCSSIDMFSWDLYKVRPFFTKLFYISNIIVKFIHAWTYTDRSFFLLLLIRMYKSENLHELISGHCIREERESSFINKKLLISFIFIIEADLPGLTLDLRSRRIDGPFVQIGICYTENFEILRFEVFRFLKFNGEKIVNMRLSHYSGQRYKVSINGSDSNDSNSKSVKTNPVNLKKRKIKKSTRWNVKCLIHWWWTVIFPFSDRRSKFSTRILKVEKL